MALPPVLQRLKFPVIGAPLFIVSNPKLVIAQCKAGLVGSMPSLNARPAAQLDEWLAEITETLAAWDEASVYGWKEGRQNASSASAVTLSPPSTMLSRSPGTRARMCSA